MSDQHKEGHHQHFILPVKMGLVVATCLLFLTWVTIAVSKVDLGAWNFTVAMLIATIKAALVFMFFMGLAYDKAESRVIFGSGVIFLAIFIILTSSDIFFREKGIYITDGKIFKEFETAAKSKFQRPWKPTPEMLAHAKPIYQAQCAMCHGAAGAGDGAAAAALNPKPRNFTAGSGWTNGRKPSQVFDTLTKGLNTMPSFATLTTDDRWSLAHLVLSYGPAVPTDTNADLKKVGITDPSSADGGAGGGSKTISIDQAINTLSVD